MASMVVESLVEEAIENNPDIGIPWAYGMWGPERWLTKFYVCEVCGSLYHKCTRNGGLQ